MYFRTIKSLAAVGAASIVVAGCGSSDEDKTTAKTESNASAAGAVPDPLRGTYTRNVTKADIERTAKFRSEPGPNQETPPPGLRRLVITRAAFKLVSPTEKPPAVIEQEIKATAGGKLTIISYIHPEVGSFCGPEIPQNAAWSWKRSGDVLSLKPVEDRCADRDSELRGDWKRTG